MVCRIFFKDCFELKYCGKCQQWIGDAEFGDHMKMENIGLNSDAMEHPQYTGTKREGTKDYMICVLHQKKVPCSSRKFDGTRCDYNPFGMIRKSFMMNCIKGLALNSAEYHLGKIHPPYFPVSEEDNSWHGVLINMDDRTVIIKGVTIHLRF